MDTKQSKNEKQEQKKPLKNWDEAVKELKGFIIEEKKKEKQKQ